MIRNLDDLEAHALKFWPPKIAETERNSSIIPKLLETQDKFISLLNIANADPFAWIKALGTTQELSANLFLKHLMVLSDIGGEKLMRFKKELPKIFRDSIMEFVWNGKNYSYTFQTLSGKKTWSNTHLKVDGVGLAEIQNLTPGIEDISNLLLFGGASLANGLPVEIEEKCTIGALIGNKRELETFVKQRYIWVSRITGGATANALGNLGRNMLLIIYMANYQNWILARSK